MLKDVQVDSIILFYLTMTTPRSIELDEGNFMFAYELIELLSSFQRLHGGKFGGCLGMTDEER